MATTQVTCPACDHVDDVVNDTDLIDAAFIMNVCLRCDHCGARISFGRLMPRIVVEPYTSNDGATFTRVRIQDPQTKEDIHRLDVDPQYGAAIARDLNFLAGLS